MGQDWFSVPRLYAERDSIPRPIARVSAAVVVVTVALFLLKSFLSTTSFFRITYECVDLSQFFSNG
ncbi:hypothetical protein HanOQP8_Chr12g0454461 [Helianthus annuus]|nr:hypothetical protein HanHA89_Chr12g0477781 [Helianthus annuus]KAJ0675741.1 hypothetical protein HanLR1_Chr12g0454671 [Helianthus annuus]KAJ0679009.1 hypothetical protein HanOQP8_Chr12g0454461 [Helianthus annuus]